MGRGRKRKFNETIPKHIDQAALPQGLYWEENRWYVREIHPTRNTVHKKTVAWADAQMSELLAIMASRDVSGSGSLKGSIATIAALFERSTEWIALSPNTQRDYRWLSREACRYVMRDGSIFGELLVNTLSVACIQRLIEVLAGGREATAKQPAVTAAPSKANHMLRYLRRLFAWGVRHGHCHHNPAKGVRQAKEAKRHRMPSVDAFQRVLAFVHDRGRLQAHSIGSISPYLHAVMILAYNVRLRGIEVCTLTDAHIKNEGIVSNRRKNSRDNITCWNADLRQAVERLRTYRQHCWEKYKCPVPLDPQQRYLIINETGYPLKKSSLDTAWQRMIRSAIMNNIITEEERFSLHGLKHLGITHSDDKRAGGHRTEAMRQHYDHELAIFPPPKLR